jgi:DNA-binding MarR family transcriptional regulator
VLRRWTSGIDPVWDFSKLLFMLISTNMRAMSRPLPVSPTLVASQCLCLSLKRAARAVARRYDEALRPLDLNNGQFSILTAIAGLQPAGMQTLADLLAMDRTTLTAALKPLERRGLVDVVASETDARGREISLTATGLALLARAIPLWQSLQQELTGELGGKRAGELRGQLSRIA